MVKQLRQVAGVKQVKVQDFKQGVFALTAEKGKTLSDAAINAAVRRSGFTVGKIVTPGGRATQTNDPKTGKRRNMPIKLDDVNRLLEQPRSAFRNENYKQARELTEKIITGIPGIGSNPHKDRDDPGGAELFQFLSLTHFAHGNFEDAAKAAHAALHRGKAWKWKRLSGHYANAKTYSAQVRSLEESIRKESTAEKRFLIGYHYLMMGYPDAARKQLNRVVKENPKDDLVRDLLKQLSKNPDSKGSSKKRP